MNLDASEAADYQYMVAQGASVYYHGTATWAGNMAGGQMGFGLCSPDPTTDYNNGAQTCAVAADRATAGSDDSGAGHVPEHLRFTQLPQTMTFQFAFPTPTNYVNCVNYSLSEHRGHGRARRAVVGEPERGRAGHRAHGSPLLGELRGEHPRALGPDRGAVHRQDEPDGAPEDFIGVPFSPFEDKNKVVMPWQWCETTYTPPSNGAMSFDTLSVPIDPNGTCTGMIGQDFTMANCTAIRDYYDFIRYTQSTQGHLNSQGLCFIDRQYPAPAGGS